MLHSRGRNRRVSLNENHIQSQIMHHSKPLFQLRLKSHSIIRSFTKEDGVSNDESAHGISNNTSFRNISITRRIVKIYLILSWRGKIPFTVNFSEYEESGLNPENSKNVMLIFGTQCFWIWDDIYQLSVWDDSSTNRTSRYLETHHDIERPIFHEGYEPPHPIYKSEIATA